MQGSFPRPWGCFRIKEGLPSAFHVFPTPVGVFLFIQWFSVSWNCLPHARGGVSHRLTYVIRFKRSSPRPWGCFSDSLQFLQGRQVFPTPVGVFLLTFDKLESLFGLPHARGGVSIYSRRLLLCSESSPRPWGCFCSKVKIALTN